MAATTGIILSAGMITYGNDAVLAPVANGGNISLTAGWRVLPATAGLALALAGLEKLSSTFAKGLAWLILAGAFVFTSASGGSAVTNASKILGYSKK